MCIMIGWMVYFWKLDLDGLLVKVFKLDGMECGLEEWIFFWLGEDEKLRVWEGYED